MNRRNWLLAIGLGLLGFVIGGLFFGIYRQPSGYIPPLKVVGDVARVVKLEDPKQMGELHDVSYDGHKYQAIKLMDIIEAAQPIASPEQIILVGSDGFSSAFPAQGLDESYITFTGKNGWEAINLNHPVNSNVKMLQEIVVVSDGSSPDFGLTIINPDKDLITITPGQLHARTLLEYPYAEGMASVENGGKTYTSSVYTRRKVFKPTDLVPDVKGVMMLVMGTNGEHRFLEPRDYLELKDNYFSYLQPEEHSQIDQVKGVVIDPPTTSIMDACYDARHFLENGEKVLVVVLEGFTYSQYTDAIANGHAAFLKKTAPAVKATGVYPLEGKVWLAAMLSGASPEENGIITEKDQDLKVPSLFGTAAQLKKPALFLHSGPRMLNTEIEPLLVDCTNPGGSADDYLYALVLDELGQNYELIVVRFNGIAFNRERYGDQAGPTRAAITANDKYLEDIAARWPGRIIIIGSPGERSERKFTCNSVFVPYLRLK
ncbi:MAG: hypothetical protein ABFD04_06375 [Syntrophomonas sp.]